jgi:hypothetical protein
LVCFALSKREDEDASAPSSHLKKDDLGHKEFEVQGSERTTGNTKSGGLKDEKRANGLKHVP